MVTKSDDESQRRFEYHGALTLNQRFCPSKTLLSTSAEKRKPLHEPSRFRLYVLQVFRDNPRITYVLVLALFQIGRFYCSCDCDEASTADRIDGAVTIPSMGEL